jgi:hypothetical protein
VVLNNGGKNTKSEKINICKISPSNISPNPSEVISEVSEPKDKF